MPTAFLTGAAIVIQSAIALYLVFGEPFYGKVAYRKLLASLDRDPSARVRFYRQIIILEWALSFLVVLSLWLAGDTVAVIGLRLAPLDNTVKALLLALALGLVLPVVLGAVSPAYRESLQRQVAPVRGMLPHRRDERWWYGLVAVTAGVCEEILFRGFLIAFLTALAPGLPETAAVVVAGGIFGMAHLYQGWGGVLTTGVLGILLGFLYVTAGSLVWPILVHALLDLRLLALPLSGPENPA